MTQGDLFPPPAPAAPPTEPEKAAAVLDYLEGEYADILAWLRQQLVKVYRFRLEVYGAACAWVTADDAREHLPRCPYRVPECKNFLGQLFRGGKWRAVGRDHVSKTPGSHGNRLTQWAYTGLLEDGGPYGRNPEARK